MPNKPLLKRGVEFLQGVDDISNIVFGQRLKNISGTVLAILGDDIRRKFVGEESERFDPTDPYCILGVRRKAPNLVVEWAYRALCHEYHPDKGKHPDGERMKAINEAYDKIKRERSASSQA